MASLTPYVEVQTELKEGLRVNTQLRILGVSEDDKMTAIMKYVEGYK